MRKEVNLIKSLKLKKHFFKLLIQKGAISIKTLPAIAQPSDPKNTTTHPIKNKIAPIPNVR